jgi:hypothetical protein
MSRFHPGNQSKSFCRGRRELSVRALLSQTYGDGNGCKRGQARPNKRADTRRQQHCRGSGIESGVGHWRSE